ncbi:DVUA0089 family protein [Leptothoe spongobia]|uniref:PEP-CTERM sorting domain-containing protein n=1 Tax=Leptothoe spongobia TAU-MAC 1115 TaxID=1967444 RepID=A0A947GK76_9CYAN|nr:DVUA0089 family protein [Leptothoe spongobia]MBT9316513.1 PEP-CTERM sorting domain-containing protein [Leptothoe spongobia TAU-MAC 1115]
MKPLSALMGVLTGAMVTTLGISGAAFAADFSLRGTFAQDADVQLFDFSLNTESTVTLRTYSYAGGTQADGTIVDAGGFDPVLTLFDGDGNKLFFNDDDNTNTVVADPTTGKAYDSFLEGVLAVGNYTLALTQYGNFSLGSTLADGFKFTGNFTGDTFSRCEAGSTFCDFTGNVRTNQWAFDAIGVLPLKEADEDKPKPKPEPKPEPGPIGNGNPPTPPTPTPPTPTPPTPTPPTPPIGNPTQVPEPTTTAAFLLAGIGAMVTSRRKS